MKKLLLLISCICLMLAINVHVTAKSIAPVNSKYVADDWKKSKTGTWEGMKDGKTYWYKLDKSAKLWWSADGKSWASVPDGMWADKDGKWLKINEGKLVWSADSGANWSEVPDWKWEGSNDKWYKFDKNWGLWVNHKHHSM